MSGGPGKGRSRGDLGDLVDALGKLGEIDGEEDATEAEAAGYRQVVAAGDRWGLFQTWDDPGGDQPVAIFTECWAALLASAVWPLMRLDALSTTEGFRIWSACEMAEGATHRPIGWFRTFNQPAERALVLAAAMARDPEALASLL